MNVKKVQGFPDEQPNIPMMVTIIIGVWVIYFILGYFELFYFGSSIGVISGFIDLPISREIYLIIITAIFLPLTMFAVIEGNMDVMLRSNANLITKVSKNIDSNPLNPLSLILTIQTKLMPLVMIIGIIASTELLVLLIGMLFILFGSIFGLIFYALALGTNYLLGYVDIQLSQYQLIALSVIYFIMLVGWSLIEDRVLGVFRSHKQPIIRSWRSIGNLVVVENFVLLSVGTEIRIFSKDNQIQMYNNQLIARLKGHRMPISKIYPTEDRIYSISSGPQNRGHWIGIWNLSTPWEFKGSLLDILDTEKEPQDQSANELEDHLLEEALSRGMNELEAREYAQEQVQRSFFQGTPRYSGPMAFNDERFALIKNDNLTVFDSTSYEIIRDYWLRKNMYHQHIDFDSNYIVDIVMENKDWLNDEYTQYIYLWDVNQEISEPMSITEIDPELNKYYTWNNILLAYNEKRVEIYELSSDTVSSKSLVPDTGTIRDVITNGEQVFVALDNKHVLVYDFGTLTAVDRVKCRDTIKQIRCSDDTLYVLTLSKGLYSYPFVELKFHP